MYAIILNFITAFLLSFFALPLIIKFARQHEWYDVPDERKSHSEMIPSLGGIAIFISIIVSVILWTPIESFGQMQYILSAFVIIFLIGARDDIDPLKPTPKLIGQLFVAAILVFKADIRISSLFGIFGVEELPFWVSVGFSIFIFIVVINAFNLIDGINGLSGSISLLASLIFGLWFFLHDRIELTMLAFALSGSLVAFLKFNFSPAKIFMGDTGALLCGLVCSVLTIEFIDMHRFATPTYAFGAVPAIAISILILPLLDTLRVFIMRIARGKSPLHSDRSHIHHILIDAGLTHMQATGVLLFINVIFILVGIQFQSMGTLNLLLVLFGLALIFSIILYIISRYQKLLKN